MPLKEENDSLFGERLFLAASEPKHFLNNMNINYIPFVMYSNTWKTRLKCSSISYLQISLILAVLQIKSTDVSVVEV